MEISKIKLSNTVYNIKDEQARKKIVTTYLDNGELQQGFLYDVSLGNYQKIVCVSDLNVVIVGNEEVGTIVTLQIENNDNWSVVFGDRILVQTKGNYVVRFIKTNMGWQIVGLENRGLSEDFVTNQIFNSLSETVVSNKNRLDRLVIPTTTSELTNDSGFITSSNVPTKVSDLENDSRYVKTIDGITADQNGTLILSGFVKTINNNTPDSAGNINLECVKTVNGISPDTDGDVIVECDYTGLVRDINGATPDDSGSVTLTTDDLMVNDVTLTQKITDLETKYEQVTTIQFAENTYYTCTIAQTNIEITFISTTNAICVFTTGDTITYTFSYADGMNVNKPFELEANKTYAIAIEHNLIAWNEFAQG